MAVPHDFQWLASCVLYAVGGLPLLGLFVFVVPLYWPMYQRLNEKGELSRLTQWFLAYASFDRTWFFLPSLLGFATLLFLIEFTMAASRRSQICRLAWAIAFSYAGILGCVVLVKGLAFPVFRHPA